MGRTKGLNTKLHLAVDAHGMPIRVIITAGPAADCTQASQLMGIRCTTSARRSWYDSDAIISQAEVQGTTSVIPPRKTGKSYIYTMRTLQTEA